MLSISWASIRFARTDISGSLGNTMEPSSTAESSPVNLKSFRKCRKSSPKVPRVLRYSISCLRIEVKPACQPDYQVRQKPNNRLKRISSEKHLEGDLRISILQEVPPASLSAHKGRLTGLIYTLFPAYLIKTGIRHKFFQEF